MGWMPSSLALSADMRMAAAAASVIWEELPAVTLPPSLKLGFRPARASRLVSGRMPSSSVWTVPSGRVMGMMLAARSPRCWAAAALWWDSTASASMSWREMW